MKSVHCISLRCVMFSVCLLPFRSHIFAYWPGLDLERDLTSLINSKLTPIGPCRSELNSTALFAVPGTVSSSARHGMLQCFMFFFHKLLSCYGKGKGKGKAVPLQAWSGPEGSRELRLPDFMTTAQDGGKVVSRTHRPPLPPGNAPGTHFC